jgi:hypothetical protein
MRGGLGQPGAPEQQLAGGSRRQRFRGGSEALGFFNQ